MASANGVEEKWSQLSATIHASAADTIGYARPRRRPWISNETPEAVDENWEAYFNPLADEAEEGLSNNQPKGA